MRPSIWGSRERFCDCFFSHTERLLPKRYVLSNSLARKIWPLVLKSCFLSSKSMFWIWYFSYQKVPTFRPLLIQNEASKFGRRFNCFVRSLSWVRFPAGKWGTWILSLITKPTNIDLLKLLRSARSQLALARLGFKNSTISFLAWFFLLAWQALLFPCNREQLMRFCFWKYDD